RGGEWKQGKARRGPTQGVLGVPCSPRAGDRPPRGRTPCRSPLEGDTSIRHFDREPPPERGPRVNEQIRISPVRLIGVDGEQLGVVPTALALEKARAANLDLVEVAAQERPPVCRILDYGKMRFENSHKGKKSAKVRQ